MLIGKSTTANCDDYKRYVKERNRLMKETEICKKYENKRFKQLKWYNYIEKQRSLTKIIKKIENAYNISMDGKIIRPTQL